jgi:hypothetical protein
VGHRGARPAVGGASQTFNDGTDIYDVSALAVFAAIPATIVMLLAAGARALYERRHHRLPGA